MSQSLEIEPNKKDDDIAFQPAPGMATSVFESKYSRIKSDGKFQTWAERLREVVDGNFSLMYDLNKLQKIVENLNLIGQIDCTAYNQYYDSEYNNARIVQDYLDTHRLAKAGVLPFSGRHLQHGDLDQKNKQMELFTNCATTMFRWLKLWLLLNGCGCSSDYSSNVCRINFDNAPNCRFVLSSAHPDYQMRMESLEDARHKYDSESENVRWFKVEDSREGWAKVVCIIETAAWQEKHKDKLFIFDFSDVRASGTPIMGQQGRPASGPVILIDALYRCMSIRGAGMKPWKQAMFIDHYLSEAVQGGGIRRSARAAVKFWKDKDIFEFIDIKRGGFLWSSNNSVAVDAKFWEQAANPAPSHGRRVFEAMCSAAYFDRTGEPGFLNVDKINDNPEGLEDITGENLISNNSKFGVLHERTIEMTNNILGFVKKHPYRMIVNPCFEISLSIFGGFCVVGDINLKNAATKDEALLAAKMITKFLIRVNTMNSIYSKEVRRTNRIGVSLTGIHEMAFKLFGFNFFDLLDEQKSQEFWQLIKSMRDTVEQIGYEYSQLLGLNTPHSYTACKPAGTIGKVCSSTEGMHLPPAAYYVRWVQMTKDGAEHKDHKKRGYPIKDISHKYAGYVAVGFPTKHPIVDIMGDSVVTTSDTTIDQQYDFLRLMEKYWLGEEKRNNQLSVTLKYDPSKVSYSEFMDLILKNQPTVRCAAVMPIIPSKEIEAIYAYQPEEVVSKKEYDRLMRRINNPFETEAYDEDQLACASGVCPIEPSINPVRSS